MELGERKCGKGSKLKKKGRKKRKEGGEKKRKSETDTAEQASRTLCRVVFFVRLFPTKGVGGDVIEFIIFFLTRPKMTRESSRSK